MNGFAVQINAIKVRSSVNLGTIGLFIPHSLEFLTLKVFNRYFLHINFKPGNHTPLGMWRKGLFLQKNKKYLILLLSPEKFVILNMREHKLIKSAERRDTDASKRTGRDDIHKSKTVS